MSTLRKAHELMNTFGGKKLAVKHCEEVIRIVTEKRTIARYEDIIKNIKRYGSKL